MRENQLPVLDDSQLARATGGDAEIMNELLGMLGAELERRLEMIRSALARDDDAAAAAQAHKLQGSAAYTGAARMGAAAAGLEASLGETGGPWRTALDDLERSAGELLLEIGRRTGRGQSSSNTT